MAHGTVDWMRYWFAQTPGCCDGGPVATEWSERVVGVEFVRIVGCLTGREGGSALVWCD